MSYKSWVLFGCLALGATQTAACSSAFSSCREKRTCPAGGAAGTAGAAGAGTAGNGKTGGNAGSNEGGTGGLDAQAGDAGAQEDAGMAGMAGESSANDLELTAPTLAVGKTYVPFTGKLSASGAARYDWSITSGSLPAGLTLQDARSATATIAGTPTEAGQFPLTFSVTDGTITKSVDVTLSVTHTALFLSDRRLAGVNELFLTDIGAASAATPVRLNATIPAGGGVTSYAWSPDGSKVLFLATQAMGGIPELWVASLASPGTAQRVSTAGLSVSTMVWLGVDNVVGYSSSIGDTYLADLSGLAPSASKLAVPGQGNPARLAPSPNGRSIVVTTPGTTLSDVHLVTWASGAPTTVPLSLSFPGGDAYYSHDGRYAVISASSGAVWEDLSSAAPSAQNTGVAHGVSLSWSPSAPVLLIETGSATYEISRFDFTSGSVTTSVLAAPSLATCSSARVQPWSPDGKNGVFTCGADLRAIADVATAKVNSDFSLLPSVSSAFTSYSAVNWSANSQWVSVLADRDVDQRFDLYLVRWSAPGVLHKPHANSTGSGVTTSSFAPNSQSVAMVGSIAPQSNAGLYLSKLPASGAPPTATLVSAPANAVVQTDINWLPGSRVITYRANAGGTTQLFALPVAADGTAGMPISVSGVSGSGVPSYQLAPTR